MCIFVQKYFCFRIVLQGIVEHVAQTQNTLPKNKYGLVRHCKLHGVMLVHHCDNKWRHMVSCVFSWIFECTRPCQISSTTMYIVLSDFLSIYDNLIMLRKTYTVAFKENIHIRTYAYILYYLLKQKYFWICLLQEYFISQRKHIHYIRNQNSFSLF